MSYGEFYDLMWVNQHINTKAIYAFLRYDNDEREVSDGYKWYSCAENQLDADKFIIRIKE